MLPIPPPTMSHLKEPTRSVRGGIADSHSERSWTWSCGENTSQCHDAHATVPTPDEAAVKALLQLLSARYDFAEPVDGEPVNWAQFEVDTPISKTSTHEEPGIEPGRVVSTARLSGASLHRMQLDEGRNMFGQELPRHGFAKVEVISSLDGSLPYATSSSNALTQGSGSGSSAGSTREHTTPSTSLCVTPVNISTPSTPQPLALRHPTAISHAFANMGSGLAEKNFNVLTPDKRTMLSIPAEYIQPTQGSRNYLHRNRGKLLFSFCLCKSFCSGATCHHGGDCDFIHCDPEKLRLVQSTAATPHSSENKDVKVHSFQVHWSSPVASLADALYARLPTGFTVHVKVEDAAAASNATQALASECVYVTVGGQEALRLSSTSPLRICKHYQREKCARGALCHFIHPVSFLQAAKNLPRKGGGARDAPVVFHDQSSRGKCQDKTTEVVPGEIRQSSALPVPRQHYQGIPAPYAVSTGVAAATTLLKPLSPQPSLLTAPSTNSAPLLTASQLPAGALVRYEENLYVWNPDSKLLIPLHATARARPSPAPGQTAPPSPPLLTIPHMWATPSPPRDNVAPAAPVSFQMPPHAMLQYSSYAYASLPAAIPLSTGLQPHP